MDIDNWNNLKEKVENATGSVLAYQAVKKLIPYISNMF